MGILLPSRPTSSIYTTITIGPRGILSAGLESGEKKLSRQTKSGTEERLLVYTLDFFIYTQTLLCRLRLLWLNIRHECPPLPTDRDWETIRYTQPTPLFFSTNRNKLQQTTQDIHWATFIFLTLCFQFWKLRQNYQTICDLLFFQFLPQYKVFALKLTVWIVQRTSTTKGGFRISEAAEANV